MFTEVKRLRFCLANLKFSLKKLNFDYLTTTSQLKKFRYENLMTVQNSEDTEDIVQMSVSNNFLHCFSTYPD